MLKDIYIPIYCENPDYLDSSSLVLDSIRIGFPNSNINVFLTGHNPVINHDITLKAYDKGARVFMYDNIRNNGELIKHRLVSGYPFILIDGDVIFWDNCEDIEFSKSIAGRLIPEYYCPLTKTLTKSRLHTSFLVFNDLAKIDKSKAKLEFNSSNKLLSSFIPSDLISPFSCFDKGRQIFYDTCANLYQCIGGEAFDENILNKYDHLGCSSFIEEVNKCEGFEGSIDFHKNIKKDTIKAKGLWKRQQEFYESAKV